MSKNRIKQFIAQHSSNPPEIFVLGGKQFTWAQAVAYADDTGKNTNETAPDMVQADSQPEATNSGTGDSQG